MVVISEAAWINPASTEDCKNTNKPGLVFVETEHFLPPGPQPSTDGANSYVVLDSRPGLTLPFSGFIAWKSAPLGEGPGKYVHHNAAGKPNWELDYGFVPLHGLIPDPELQAAVDQLVSQAWERTDPALYPGLAKRVQADLHVTNNSNDLGTALAKDLFAHLGYPILTDPTDVPIV